MSTHPLHLASAGRRSHPSGLNCDHRKQWIDDQLVHQAGYFGIDLLCHANLSNHRHLILRSRPDVVAEWDDTEVARRWLMLCPLRLVADFGRLFSVAAGQPHRIDDHQPQRRDSSHRYRTQRETRVLSSTA